MYNDAVLFLTKRDRPNDKEYVCLGHFDRASFVVFDELQRTSGNELDLRSFYDFNDSQVMSKYKTTDPEGLQQNYLIHSGVEYGSSTKDTFRFVMTISLKREEQLTKISDYIDRFRQRLENAGASVKGFGWKFYYPVSRGDVILIHESDDFGASTKALYDFVHGNPLILYSFTIPMIKKEWIDNPGNLSAVESKVCSMHLRATVRHYDSFCDFIFSLNVPCEQNGYPKFFASFGTDDILVDFGRFSEKKLHTYIQKIIDPVNQDKLRAVAFSTEIAVPRNLGLSRKKKKKRERKKTDGTEKDAAINKRP